MDNEAQLGPSPFPCMCLRNYRGGVHGDCLAPCQYVYRSLSTSPPTHPFPPFLFSPLLTNFSPPRTFPHTTSLCVVQCRMPTSSRLTRHRTPSRPLRPRSPFSTSHPPCPSRPLPSSTIFPQLPSVCLILPDWVLFRPYSSGLYTM